jgi:ribosomal protein L14E/L6E/L27E
VASISIQQRKNTPMNRRKKIKQLLEAHAKKANAKLAPRSNKPKYISKADRAKLETEAAQGLVTPTEQKP